MLTVLLVDDEKLERKVISYLVEKYLPRLEVIGETSNGMEAVELALQLQPDIVLIDIKMPTINGLEATRRIKEKLKKVKIVIVTAYDEFELAQEAVKVGATDYLLKPVHPEEIVRILDSLTEQILQEKTQEAEEQRLKERLAMVMPFIQMSFLNDLLSGRIESLRELEERANFLNFNPLPAVAILADIDHFMDLTSGQPELNKQLLKKEVFNIIKKATKYIPNTVIAPTAGDQFVILYSPLERDPITIKDKAIELGEKIRSLIQNSTPATVTIGIGNYYPEATDIAFSYNEARKALYNRHFMGANQVIHVQDVERYRRSPLPYSYRKERQFLERVRTGNQEEAKKILLEIIEESLVPCAYNMDLVRSLVTELLIVFSRTLAEVGGDTETFSSFTYIQQLSCFTNIEEIKHWLLGLIEKALEQNDKNKLALNSQVVTSAIKYLKENFRKDISLEEISHYVHLSPYYFSRIFKKETGLNFVEYLTKLRIEEAKRMLRNSEESIINIASIVGYNEPNYFSRVFRKLEGITPKQYRALR